jgi:hypothetical protein
MFFRVGMTKCAGLYVYEHHGDASNTWGRQHFDGLIYTYGVAACEEIFLKSEIGYER